RRHTRSKRDWSSDVCSSDLGEKELLTYVDQTELNELKEQYKTSDIKVKDATVFSSFDEIEEWMKEKEAYAVYQPVGNGNRRIRERALEFDLLIFTAEETLKAFSTIPKHPSEVKAIGEFELVYEKEVVLQ